MKRIALLVLSGLLGLFILNSGLNKFLHHMPMPEMSEEVMKDTMGLMECSWLFPLVGVIEIIGGIFLIIPRTRALGALIILPIMVGILLFHLPHQISGFGIVVAMCLILLWVIYEERSKYLQLLK